MRVAPKRPESPLSVCTARKTSLMSSGIDAPLLEPLVEREQIAAEPVDDLLRLGEELVARLVAAVAATASAARLMARGRPRCGSRGRGEAARPHVLAELLGREGLGEVRVGAEREPALDVALRRAASR